MAKKTTSNSLLIDSDMILFVIYLYILKCNMNLCMISLLHFLSVVLSINDQVDILMLVVVAVKTKLPESSKDANTPDKLLPSCC